MEYQVRNSTSVDKGKSPFLDRSWGLQPPANWKINGSLQENTRYPALLQQLPVLGAQRLEITSQGYILSASPALLRHLGLSKYDLLCEPVWRFVSTGDTNSPQRLLHQLKNLQPNEIVLLHWTVSGGVRQLSLRVEHIYNQAGNLERMYLAIVA